MLKPYEKVCSSMLHDAKMCGFFGGIESLGLMMPSMDSTCNYYG